jgi:DNA-binding NtrC family response regulator
MNTPLSNQGQGKGPCLLVIEDDDVLNQLLARELRKAGYEVRSVHTWAQARQCMIGYSPELVLLDMQLPDSSGLEPLSELATTQPVVMLTAYGDVHQAVQAMRLGAADYLVKPVDLDELELVIRRALEKSELQKQKECLVGPRGTPHAMPMVGTSAAMQRLREQIAEVANPM